MTQEQPDQPENRRKSARVSVGRTGVIVINGLSTFNVAILELTRKGAKLQLLGEIPIPEFFELRYEGFKVRARRAWVRQTMIGVEFVP